MKKPAKNKGLRNPALVAAASSPAGQGAITNATETQRKLADTGISLIPFMVKTIIVVGGIWYAARLYTKRFIKLGINPNLPKANVTNGQAQMKADALFEAMYGIGANHQKVAEQLAGINYNAWVLVYNAFGNRKGVGGLGEGLNLVEWLTDQFDTEQLNELRFLVNGVF